MELDYWDMKEVSLWGGLNGDEEEKYTEFVSKSGKDVVRLYHKSESAPSSIRFIDIHQIEYKVMRELMDHADRIEDMFNDGVVEEDNRDIDQLKKYARWEIYDWLPENAIDDWDELPTPDEDEDAWDKGVDILISKYFIKTGEDKFIVKLEYDDDYDEDDYDEDDE